MAHECVQDNAKEYSAWVLWSVCTCAERREQRDSIHAGKGGVFVHETRAAVCTRTLPQTLDWAFRLLRRDVAYVVFLPRVHRAERVRERGTPRSAVAEHRTVASSTITAKETHSRRGRCCRVRLLRQGCVWTTSGLRAIIGQLHEFFVRARVPRYLHEQL